MLYVESILRNKIFFKYSSILTNQLKIFFYGKLFLKFHVILLLFISLYIIYI